MSPQAILRIAKIKSWQALKGCANHNRRNYEVPNADPTGQISFLLSNPTQDIVETAKEKIGNQHVRKNAVLAVETVLSASAIYFRPEAPEAFGTWSEPKLEAWKQASLDWLNDKLGDRLLEVALHLDEGTPHTHCLWIPLDEQGKLSYFRTEFGGNKSSLSKIQDSYAKTLAPLGIERGIKKSKAFHQHIQKYYQAVNQASLNIEDINQLFPQPEPEEDANHYRARTISTLTPTLETMQAQLVHRQWVMQEKEQKHTLALRSEKERQRLEKCLEELESSQPPVEEIAYELGFDPDLNNKQWKRGNDTIEIVENTWKKPGESIHGAVDFVMEFGGYNFKKV